MTSRRRRVVHMSEKTPLAKSLKGCAAAVSGAAMALGAGEASAEVRYTDVEPDLSTQYITNTASSIDVFIDVDGQVAVTGVHGDPVAVPDGTDFYLNYTNDTTEKPEFKFPDAGSNWFVGEIAKTGNNYDYSNMFGPHEEIGPNYSSPPINVSNGTLWARSGWLENDQNEEPGPWHEGGVNGVNGVGTGFLGFRLDFDGLGLDYNYGWAQVRYDDPANVMTLLDFAIESEVNTPITTPDITPPPVSLVGDFNDDLVVDGADLEQWKGDFGAGVGSDADGDGDSDGADFLLWQQNFGQTAGAIEVSAIPEPHSLALAAMGAGGLRVLRRRRQR